MSAFITKSLPDGLGKNLVSKKTVNEIKIPAEEDIILEKALLEKFLKIVDKFDEYEDIKDVSLEVAQMTPLEVLTFIKILKSNDKKINYFEKFLDIFIDYFDEIDLRKVEKNISFRNFCSLFWLIHDKNNISKKKISKLLIGMVHFFSDEKFFSKNLNENRYKNKYADGNKIIIDAMNDIIPAKSIPFTNTKCLEFLSEESAVFMLEYINTLNLDEEIIVKFRSLLSFWSNKIGKYLLTDVINLFSLAPENLVYEAADIKNNIETWPAIDEITKMESGKDRFVMSKLEEFEERFHLETQGLFRPTSINGKIHGFPWGKAIVAGGLIERLLSPLNKVPEQSDIDIFVFGRSEIIRPNFEAVIDWIGNFAKNVLKSEIYLAVKASVVSIYIKGFKRKIQVVVRQNTTPEDIIAEFDIACIRVYYNGAGLYTNWAGYNALRTRITSVEFKYTSLFRCMKVLHRGYSIKKFDVRFNVASNTTRKVDYSGKIRNDKYVELYMNLESTLNRESAEFKIIHSEFLKKYYGAYVHIGENDVGNKAQIMNIEAVNTIFTGITSEIQKRVSFSDNFRSGYNFSSIENFGINSFALKSTNIYTFERNRMTRKPDSVLHSYANGSIISARYLRGEFFRNTPNFISSKNEKMEELINDIFKKDQTHLYIFAVDIENSGREDVRMNEADQNSSIFDPLITSPESQNDKYINYINDLNTEDFVLKSVDKDKRIISYFIEENKKTKLLFFMGDSIRYMNINQYLNINEIKQRSSGMNMIDFYLFMLRAADLNLNNSIYFNIRFQVKHQSESGILYANIETISGYINEYDFKEISKNLKDKKSKKQKNNLMRRRKFVNNNNNNESSSSSSDKEDEIESIISSEDE
jgi:hypothetical protein